MKKEDEVLLNELCGLVGYKHPEYFQQTVDEFTFVFNALPNFGQNRVVELGPGLSPKLLFALNSCDFKDILALVDLDQTALAVQRYTALRLKPSFKVETHNQNLFNFDLSGYSLIVGNHLIDDLVAADFADRYGINYSEVFNDPKGQERFWQVVAQDRAATGYTISRLGEKLSEVDKKAIWITTNYAANFDLVHGIGVRQALCDGLLTDLRLLLQDSGFIDLDIKDIPGSKKWLIMQKA